jgi:hypothetical protein
VRTTHTHSHATHNNAALTAEDFGLLQLYAESFQAAGALTTFLKSHRAAARAAAKTTAGAGSDSTQQGAISSAAGSDIVMVTAAALSAQVYPDSRFGSLHAKQLTSEWQCDCLCMLLCCCAVVLLCCWLHD